MPNRWGLKNPVQRTSQCVKRTSGARDLTIYFRELLGPMSFKLPAFYVVVVVVVVESYYFYINI